MLQLATFILVFLPNYFVFGEECKVVLKSGTVVGTINPEDKKGCVYMAIPYASPPTGSLRFRPPQPAKSWDTPLNATSSPNWCPQPGAPPQGIKISEDCLYLNVYQPQTRVSNTSDDSGGLPVMIFIHGGGFTAGSSLNYDPTRMQQRADVVMVVVHYRLGLLGFYSTGDFSVPGNNGLKDQAFSIRWVHENIRAFGGNPEKITIFGESAGGASVMYQLISPLNKGLISGAIAQSGTALAFWALDKNPKESAKMMAGFLGCPSIFGSLIMVACMRNVSVEAIINLQNLYTAYSWSQMSWAYATLTPVVEPRLAGAFISDEPEAIMRKGEIPDIPVIIGANKHDGSFILGLFYAVKYGPQKLDKNPEYMKDSMVPEILKFAGVRETHSGSRGMASSVELAYLNGVNRSSWEESMPGLVDIFSVFAFKSDAENSAEILSRRNRTVYLYSYEYQSRDIMCSLGEGIPVKCGVAHADGKKLRN